MKKTLSDLIKEVIGFEREVFGGVELFQLGEGITQFQLGSISRKLEMTDSKREIAASMVHRRL